MVDYEGTLVILFAGLLMGGSVMVLAYPFIYSLTTGRGWGLMGALLLPILGMAVVGIGVVSIFLGDTTLLVPVVALVAGLRVVSPTITFLKVQTLFEPTKYWLPVKLLLAATFMGMAGYMTYRTVVPATTDALLLGERALMAVGTAFLLTRAYSYVMPRLEGGRIYLLVAAILFSVSLGIIAPYAFPGFDFVYLLSGIAGWVIAFVLVLKSV